MGSPRQGHGGWGRLESPLTPVEVADVLVSHVLVAVVAVADVPLPVGAAAGGVHCRAHDHLKVCAGLVVGGGADLAGLWINSADAEPGEGVVGLQICALGDPNRVCAKAL